MPSTFEAIAVLALVLLPGALFTWSFERLAGRWGAGLSDRVFRFVGSSAIFHVLVAPASYWFWSRQLPKLRAGGEDPHWSLWLAAIAYVAIPLAAGSLVGSGTRRGSKWATWVTGPDPAPRAWDYLFQGERDGWIRLRLKSGSWLAGGYATSTNGLKSYSAGYPEAQDLYLATAIRVDEDSGAFLLDEDGNPESLAGGLLVRWEEIEYLEFIDA